MKRWCTRLLVTGTVLTSAIVAQGCESLTVVAAQVAQIRVDTAELIIYVDDTEVLSASPHDTAGNLLSGRVITWLSTDSGVATVDVSGRVLGRAEGTALIEATAEGVTGSVLVTVIARPQIVVSRNEARFRSPSGGSPPRPVSIRIMNGVDGSTLSGLELEVAYGSDGAVGWLQTVLSSSTAPATLGMRALPEALPVGSYGAEVRITSPIADNSPQVVRVLMEVGEPVPAIAVNPGATTFAADAGQAAPPSQVVDILNAGGGVLSGIHAVTDYSAGSSQGWLQTSLNRRTAPAELTVAVDLTGLTPGNYDAIVRIAATSVPGTTAELRVGLRFGDPPPEIELEALDVIWDVLEGTSVITPRNVAIGNRGTGSLGGLDAQVTYPIGTLDGWLQTTVVSTTAPTLLELSVVDPGLEVGEYSAYVTISSPDAINSPQTLAILLRVSPRPSPSLSTITPFPSLIPPDGISTSTIGVQLIDVRGDPVSTGQHLVELAATAGSLGPVVNHGNGTYAALPTSTTSVQRSTVSGAVNGEPLADVAVIDFMQGPPDPGTSTIMAAPTVIPADGVSIALVTVQALDAIGNLLTAGGAKVDLSTNLGIMGPVTDVGDGTYTAVLTSSQTAGTATVTGTLGAAAIADDERVVFRAGTPTAIQLTGPVSMVEGGTSTNFTLTVVDAFGNPTSAGPTTKYSLASRTDASGTFAPTSPVTVPSNGSTVTFTYSSTVVGLQTVTATWNNGGGVNLGSATHNTNVIAPPVPILE